MNYTENDRKVLWQGFRDGLESRDIPPRDYSKEEVRKWREGARDGFTFSKHFWVAYHDVQKREITSPVFNQSFMTRGFASVIANAPVAASEMSKENRVLWNKGCRAARRFQDVYETRYHVWLLNTDLLWLLIQQDKAGKLPQEINEEK